MKKFLVLFALLALAVSFAYAEPFMVEEEAEGPNSICPATRVSGELSDCQTCHIIPTWELKEPEPYVRLKDNLPRNFTIVDRDCVPVVCYELNGITAGAYAIIEITDWFLWHPEFKHLRIEIFSPGGSLFHGQQIAAKMDLMKKRGVTVETVVHGYAASAGFYVAVSGSPGYRYASRDAQLMWHQLWTFKMFDVSTPADKKDEADVLEHLQNTANERIARVTGLSVEDIEAKIYKKEFWLSGSQCVELGVVDHVLD